MLLYTIKLPGVAISKVNQWGWNWYTIIAQVVGMQLPYAVAEI